MGLPADVSHDTKAIRFLISCNSMEVNTSFIFGMQK